jgi:hypothetical protein
VLKYNCDDAGLYIRIQSFWDLVPTGRHTIDDEDKTIEVLGVVHSTSVVSNSFSCHRIPSIPMKNNPSGSGKYSTLIS